MSRQGLVDGLPMADYLAEPALSGGGSRKLLPPHAPAVYQWERKHPTGPSDAMELGSAIHQVVLGDIEERIRYVDAASWQGKAAQAERKALRAEGLIPLLAKQREDVEGSAAAIKAHSLASRLFAPGSGRSEVSMFWTDPETGVPCKGRLDWLPGKRRGRLLFPDLKTAASADPQKWAKSAADFGYHIQADWYLGGLRQLGLADETAAFVFVVVEPKPPYLLKVCQIDAEDLAIAAYLNRKARRLYAECVRTDTWPGLSEDVETVSLPAYYRSRHDAAFDEETDAA